MGTVYNLHRLPVRANRGCHQINSTRKLQIDPQKLIKISPSIHL